ncbi:beta-carotene 15,15'-dioxygenase, Brp/Blh family [Quadrisphaera setariae]|uniref:Probable beta-carotene 15,15'-dioxygenase n=1 Tax=Quadrisphaera setariae TaxID=2593304 RepID=A0A5C8ZLU0_9ACTN|nr:beta-carotene 15,15'-dioxygenase, Brp/Blh family [Quadrisphaera setariae]TXR58018.1 hypothetical protein FMM08_02010 [Quadrisphaera setariae]
MTTRTATASAAPLTHAPAVSQVLPRAARWRVAVLHVPWAAAAGCTLVAAAATPPGRLLPQLAGPGLSAGPALAPLLVVSLLVGLPHGAVDLVRPETGATGSRGRRAAAAAVYLLTAAAAFTAWLVAPLPVLLGLLALAVVHFGTADAVTARWTGSATPGPGRVLRAVRVVALGGPPVVLTLGLHGGAVSAVLDGLSGGRGAAVASVARAAVPVVLAAAAAVVVAAALQRRPAAALEPLLLVALCAVVTPLLAFAVYFGLWHSWRQVARMVASDAAHDHLGTRAALRGFVRQAALPTAVSVVGLVALVTLGGAQVLVTGLAAVLCLTVPHAVAVARADARVVVAPPPPHGVVRTSA